MEKYIGILRHTKLFAGVGEADVASMLHCLQTRMRRCGKGEYVFRQGEHLDCIAVLVEGGLHVQRDDYWGNRTILAQLSVGEMFGEAYVSPDSGPLLNDVVAVQDSTVLLFDVRRILTVCSSACRFHAMVVQNLFFAISEKNRQLVQKLDHMGKRTTREKLLSYLSEEADKQGGRSFVIPFNRQQLADYLSVDRSAMSNELSRMREEGLIQYEKNHFTLL